MGADMSDDQLEQTLGIFQKLLVVGSSKLYPGQRRRFRWNSQRVHCLVDLQGKTLYCVVTSASTFPHRLADQMLRDFNTLVLDAGDLDGVGENGLNERLGPKLPDFVADYVGRVEDKL